MCLVYKRYIYCIFGCLCHRFFQEPQKSVHCESLKLANQVSSHPFTSSVRRYDTLVKSAVSQVVWESLGCKPPLSNSHLFRDYFMFSKRYGKVLIFYIYMFFWYTYIYIRLNICFCLFLPFSQVTCCNRTTVSEDCDAPLIFFTFWSPMCSKTMFRRGIFGRNVTIFGQDPTSVDTQGPGFEKKNDPGSFWSFLIQVTWVFGITLSCFSWFL